MTTRRQLLGALAAVPALAVAIRHRLWTPRPTDHTCPYHGRVALEKYETGERRLRMLKGLPPFLHLRPRGMYVQVCPVCCPPENMITLGWRPL